MTSEAIADSKPKCPLSQKDFLDYLQAELAFQQASIKKEGWTKWILIVAIASVAWFAYNIIPSLSGPSFANILLSLAILSTIRYAYISIAGHFSSGHHDFLPSSPFYSHTSTILEPIKAYLFIGISELFFCLFIYYKHFGFSRFYLLFLYLPILFFLIFHFAGYVLTITPIPVTKKTFKESFSNTFDIVDVTISVVSLFGALRAAQYLYFNIDGSFYIESKVILSIAAIYYLIQRLHKDTAIERKIENIATIRRNFCNGFISYDECIIRIRIIFYGTTPSEFIKEIQDRVSFFRNWMDYRADKIKGAVAELKTFLENTSPPINSKEAVKLVRLPKTLLRELKIGKKALREINTQLKLIRFKVVILRSFGIIGEGDTEIVFSNIKDVQLHIDKRLNDMGKMAEGLLSIISKKKDPTLETNG